jgi:hypothetical protein
MKYLKILIAVLVVILVGIGAFYAYLVLSRPKPKISVSTLNTKTATPYQNVQPVQSVQPIQKENGLPVDTKIHDYTTADSAASGGTLKIQGYFQSADPGEKVINGITYTYVVGILDDNRNYSTIWLTANEYQEISTAVSSDDIWQGSPVILTLSQNSVSLEEAPPPP